MNAPSTRIVKRPIPLLIVGIDAGEPAWLREWIADGHLPHLAAVLREGSIRSTGGADITMEHGAWVTLMSGVPRSTHGYYYYRELVPGTYRLALTPGPVTPVVPFWSRLAGHVVVVVDVPDFRPLPGLDGIQLSDLAVHNRQRETAGIPEEARERALRTIGDVRDIPEAFRSDPAADLQIRSRLLARVERKGEVCRQFITEQQPDLAVIGFGESHTAGHQFWRYQHQKAAHPVLTSATRDVYQAIDQQIGALRAAMPESHRIVVLTSVGLRALYPGGELGEAFLRALGYQQAPVAAPSRGVPGPLTLARRLLPERLREWLSRPLGRAFRERLYADRFANGTDWSRSRVFAIPSAFQSFLRVNLAGREPKGIVSPGSEYHALLDELERELRLLTDPETGRSLSAGVFRPAGTSGRAPDTLPDLVVDWAFTDRFIHRIEHPRATITLTEPEFFRDSEHNANGVLLVSGPGCAARGEQPPIDARDVADWLARLMTSDESEMPNYSPSGGG